ncbi:transglutaminase family protein [Synechococcus sp. CBW1002]|uniref:transglutaminase family protein n=1 Tax=Synechococcus sp. CBW1002 TaxID=1353134 RepID=UPI001E44AB13|nr:transglutaminase family protein [Synechococcus sp. CBW1002]
MCPSGSVFFQIRHELHYAYARPVFLEPMTLRLTPRQDCTQTVLSHRLQVRDPADGAAAVLEPGGGDGLVLWFHKERQTLHLQVEMQVETHRDNPFDWIVTEPAARHLPLTYTPALRAALAPCLGGPQHPQVSAWAAELAESVQGSTTDFLMALADQIHHGFHHVGRPDGAALQPEQTLQERTGACRDTAVLYVAACRSLGLAARFVSGYSMHHPPEVSEHELHAWAEVYVPGGGWRAYDPSLGLAVADGHVVLAAAADPELAAAVSGTYRGTGVTSTMEYRVDLRAAETRKALG